MESAYRDVYALLNVFIEKDWYHRELGEHVQDRLSRTLCNVRYY